MRSVLLIEDDSLLRAEVARALEHVSGGRLSIVAAKDGSSGLSLATRGEFDVALVDLGLPDIPGAQVIEQLLRLPRPLRALAFTVFDDREQVLSAISAGAVGYVLKDEPPLRVFELLEESLEGHTPISSRSAELKFAEENDTSTRDAQGRFVLPTPSAKSF